MVVASKGQHGKGEEERVKLNEGPDSIKRYKVSKSHYMRFYRFKCVARAPRPCLADVVLIQLSLLCES